MLPIVRVKAGLLHLHATSIMLTRAVLFPILSSLPPDHAPSADQAAFSSLKVINCAVLLLICIYNCTV